MLGAILTIIVLGTNKIGSFADVWNAAARGGRLNTFEWVLFFSFQLISFDIVWRSNFQLQSKSICTHVIFDRFVWFNNYVDIKYGCRTDEFATLLISAWFKICQTVTFYLFPYLRYAKSTDFSHTFHRSVVIFIIGMIIIKFLALYIGLCLYAKFEHCDPVAAGLVHKSDQVNIVKMIFYHFLLKIRSLSMILIRFCRFM